jgi:hypothetical protein
LGLHVRVAGFEHGGKPRHFLFAPTLFARFLEVPMVPNNLQRSFAINLLLQAPQDSFNRLAFFYFNLGQNSFTSSPVTMMGNARPSWPAIRFGQ